MMMRDADFGGVSLTTPQRAKTTTTILIGIMPDKE
jgi:hypothetical protein